MNLNVDPALLIEELKAQRNDANDKLAAFGAVIMQLRKELEEAKKKTEEVTS